MKDKVVAAELEEGADNAQTAEFPETEKKPEKKMSRLKAFFFNRKAEKEFRRENNEVAEKTEKSSKENRKLSEYLSTIEEQLDKVDEQNKVLLFYLTTVKENNEALINQINILSKNNEQLFHQFMASKKREKLAKIIAIVSSGLAIGYTLYRFIMLIIQNGGW